MIFDQTNFIPLVWDNLKLEFDVWICQVPRLIFCYHRFTLVAHMSDWMRATRYDQDISIRAWLQVALVRAFDIFLIFSVFIFFSAFFWNVCCYSLPRNNSYENCGRYEKPKSTNCSNVLKFFRQDGMENVFSASMKLIQFVRLFFRVVGARR